MMRQARPDDRELLRPLGHSPGDIEFISAPLGRGAPAPITMVWQAPDGALLGSASAVALPAFPGLWLTGYVRVLPAARGAGIGKALVRATAAAAHSAGALRAYCTIEPGNHSSVAIHVHEGYRALPAARSSLRAETSVATRSGSATVRLSPLDRATPLNALARDTGIDALVTLPPGHRPALGLLGPVAPPPGPRGWWSRFRGRRGESLWRVAGTDGAGLGLLVIAADELRLAVTRAALRDATAELMGEIQAAAQAVSGTADSARIALFHDPSAVVPPGLLERTHVFYAVEFASP